MHQNEKIISSLKGGLVVSCQALPGEPLAAIEGGIMWRMALAAEQGGAVGIRSNGMVDIRQIKEHINLPIIGILKKVYSGYDPFITPTIAEVDQLVQMGVDIIALDCTDRIRPHDIRCEEFLFTILNKYPDQLFMADISTFEEGVAAWKQGMQLVGTTLSGYTPYSRQEAGPDFALIQKLAQTVSCPVLAEGKIICPSEAKKAFDCGAHTVIVGGAISRPKEITTRFVEAIRFA